MIFAPPVVIDLLGHAIAQTRRHLSGSVKERVRIYWAAVVAARNLGASDVIRDAFMQLAIDSGLRADLMQCPPFTVDGTLEHLIRWGLLDRDPFGDRHG